MTFVDNIGNVALAVKANGMAGIRKHRREGITKILISPLKASILTGHIL